MKFILMCALVATASASPLRQIKLLTLITGLRRMRMMRKMIGGTLFDRHTNEWLSRTVRIPDICELAVMRKWSWARHVSRMANDRWARILLEWCPIEAQRPPGRPKQRWRDEFEEAVGRNWMRTAREEMHTWKDDYVAANCTDSDPEADLEADLQAENVTPSAEEVAEYAKLVKAREEEAMKAINKTETPQQREKLGEALDEAVQRALNQQVAEQKSDPAAFKTRVHNDSSKLNIVVKGGEGNSSAQQPVQNEKDSSEETVDQEPIADQVTEEDFQPESDNVPVNHDNGGVPQVPEEPQPRASEQPSEGTTTDILDKTAQDYVNDYPNDGNN